MPRNFRQKSFISWLDKNAGRFNNPPCDINFKRGGVQFRLQGIIPEIHWDLFHGSHMLLVDYKNTIFWDAIAECDVDEEKNTEGQYYNYWSSLEEQAGGQKTLFYPTRTALWEQEGFEQILLLSNKRTKAGLYLCIFGVADSTTWALVYPKEKITTIKDNKCFVAALPVNI